MVSLTVDWNVKGVSQENRVLRVGGQQPLIGQENRSDRRLTMISVDSMWVDPNKIRLQEEYQAQLDRMIGKRPDQP
jgi:hypothetical protein